MSSACPPTNRADSFTWTVHMQTHVQNALKNLEEFATMMRVLGSYPASA